MKTFGILTDDAPLPAANAEGGTIDRLSHQTRSGADCTTTAIPLGTTVRGRILVERQRNIAIYEGPYLGAYEVVVIRVVEASEIAGNKLVRRELYPSSESWGTWGFTFSPASHVDPLAAAKEKLKKLIRSAKTGNATERLLLHPPKKTPYRGVRLARRLALPDLARKRHR